MTSALRRLTSFYLSMQFVRFLAAGGVALVVHWLSRFVFNLVVDFGWAVVLAYGVGISVAFVLNKLYVFPHSERSLKVEIFFFFAVNISAFPLVWVVAYVLGEWILVHYLRPVLALAIAHGVAITLPVVMNYALHKLVTFRGA